MNDRDESRSRKVKPLPLGSPVRVSRGYCPEEKGIPLYPTLRLQYDRERQEPSIWFDAREVGFVYGTVCPWGTFTAHLVLSPTGWGWTAAPYVEVVP